MPLSRLAVYTIAHGIDSIQDHLDRLSAIGLSPDLVALELPDVEDTASDIRAFRWEIIKQSPATGFSWYVIERVNRNAYENTDSSAASGDSEFEAGRRYAEQHDVPCVSVDLERTEVANRYATWSRRVRDIVVLLAGGVASLVIWFAALLVALFGILVFNYQESLITGLLVLSLAISVAVAIGYMGRLPVYLAIGKIGRWFRDAIREIRDEAMYEQIKNRASKHSATDVLIIVGAAHLSGIRTRAEQDGVECLQIESPAISQYEGDLEDFSTQEWSELVSPDDDD